MSVGDFATEINGRTLEYLDDIHCYLIDGVITPSITQILKTRFGKKYDGVDRRVLDMAARAGTAVHDAIQTYCETGEAAELPEVANFAFLQRQYQFDVIECETPMILFDGETPIAAGRCDLVLRQGGQIGGADIKRTSVLDRDYLAAQLNLYRIAYRQSYGIEWQFLRGIHLRNDTRKYVQIPIDENRAWQIINEWRQQNVQEQHDAD